MDVAKRDTSAVNARRTNQEKENQQGIRRGVQQQMRWWKTILPFVEMTWHWWHPWTLGYRIQPAHLTLPGTNHILLPIWLLLDIGFLDLAMFLGLDEGQSSWRALSMGNLILLP